MDKWKSRKLIAALVLSIQATWLLVAGHISGEVWSSFMAMNVVGYMIGNGAEHFAKKP